MNKLSKIYIAGHTGLVGSSLLRHLRKNGFTNIITINSNKLDLRDSLLVSDFFKKNEIEYVFLCAAKVGGILANNTKKAEFIYDNLMIQSNIIHNSFLNKVKKLLFLGSSCIYPKLSKQPISEDSLLTAPLELTNEPYAIAKIAGIKMCDAYRYQYGCNFISAMPTNMYGPNDNYDLSTCHVLPALIRKFYEARKNNLNEVVIWGDGTPKREFMHVDDCAIACLFLMQKYNDPGIINIGTGSDISIKELALLIKNRINYKGEIKFDFSKPNGTPRKLLNVLKINDLGWKHSISLENGLQMLIENIEFELNKYL
tara:strand:- start:12 stop:950 length:939 start_codon:yes stop_codon:yes gene_type:complete